MSPAQVPAALREQPIPGAALVLGAIGTVVCVIAMATGSLDAFQAYLCAHLFWLSLSLGGALVIAMHAVTGGAWGNAAAPVFTAAGATLPWMAPLALPWLLGLGTPHGIEWPRQHLGPGTAHLEPFMAPGWFWLRAIAYFAVWTTLFFLLLPSDPAREAAESATRTRSRRFAAAAIILYAATFTMASIDWIMVLEAPWSSTIFALHLAIGAQLGVFGLALLVPRLTPAPLDPDERVPMPRTSDLGNLTLAFLLLWVYLGFSQYLVIWSGDLPAENVWYLRRAQGGWLELSLAVVGVQFAMPFLALLSRTVKQTPIALGAVGAAVLIGHALHFYWVVGPAYEPRPLMLRWQDVSAFAGIGGLWAGLFLLAARRRAERAT